MMKQLLKLLRVKHYIKNVLVFLPMFFGGVIFEKNRIINACLGFIAFSFLSSVVYIINDYRDIEKDRNHPTKRNRPLASGAISIRSAALCSVVLLVVIISVSTLIGNYIASACLLGYLLLNVLYSMGLKNKPVIDVVILATGFVIRVIYGGLVTGVTISKWLYLVVVTGSLYMGLGKRRNELRGQTDSREVLKYYNESFLDKNMYVCVALVNVFYALWSIEMPNPRMIWTVPFFIVLLMCYSLDIEGDSDGDPVEVIIHDKSLMTYIIMYAVYVFLFLYIF
ncbi:decaprenyl-phosphate phosphoribosyltransferase [Butyrivibrio sp. MB2005]|uniref:decaprenyl-phosphate phosphoribosyltransferase n=1 Tax=Butyrivibrio sp. MB2005 TaxID=1280678 RepID=UPI001FA6C813|nr:decaprenyl-phosphate phosphoribosyltransferase [Butyrivibrio sp. MB2005]